MRFRISRHADAAATEPRQTPLFLAPYALFIATVASVALLLGCAPRSQADPPSGYVLEWAENFNESPAGSNYPTSTSPFWNFENGTQYPDANYSQWGTGEIETNTEQNSVITTSTDPGSADGLALDIEGQYSSATGLYTSARMDTQGKVLPEYGYIEARMKLPSGTPAVPALGFWPAFWMLGSTFNTTTGTGWPNCGETDILEATGDTSLGGWGYAHGTLHFYSPNSDEEYITDTSPIPDQNFHTYGILWQQNSIAFYVDSTLYQTLTPANLSADPYDTSWPFNEPMYILLDLAIGGNFGGTVTPSTWPTQTSSGSQGDLLIDYVHIYEQPFNTTPAAIPGSFNFSDYDPGGQGVSYNTLSTTTTNNGGTYRPGDNVDIQPVPNGTGYYVDDTATGQWMQYAVNINAANTLCTLTLNAGATASTESIQIFDDTNGVMEPVQVIGQASNSISLPNTGSLSTFAPVTAYLEFPATGQRILRVEETGAGQGSLESMSFAPDTTVFPWSVIPGRIQASNFDIGGPGIGYNTVSGNAPDVQPLPSPLTGNYVDDPEATQWMQYTVQALSPVQYVAFSVSSASGGGEFHLDRYTPNFADRSAPTDEVPLTGEIVVPKTTTDNDGSAGWTTIVVPLSGAIPVDGNPYVVRLVEDSGDGKSADGGDFDIAYMQFYTTKPNQVLSGTVERTGDLAAVPNAVVTVTNTGDPDDAVSFTAVTNSKGEFSVSPLFSGDTYTVSATAAGYNPPATTPQVSLPQSGSLTIDVIPQYLYFNNLQMVSAPNDYSSLALNEALLGFVDATTAGTHGTELDTFSETLLDSTGVGYTAATSLAPGQGFWLIPSNDPANPQPDLALNATGYNTIDPTQPFVIPLVSGWNIIGDPFPIAVNVNDLRSGSVTLPQPAGKLISLTFYTYNSALSSGYEPTTVGGALQPYIGYWVWSSEAGDLIVNAPATTTSDVKVK